MDILSFILGMCMVVVIAVAIVAVISFVKVNKLNKEIESLHSILSMEVENQNRERDQIVQDIYRTLDSRLDKLENKLIIKK